MVVVAAACSGPAPAPAPPPRFDAATRTDDAFNRVFRHEFARVGEVNLHYVIGGRGPEVVVLLHGWPETWYEWRRVMPALSERYTVIAADLPGLGDSQGQPAGYDKRTLARYLHGLVADRLGRRAVAVVGHDLGAGVAYQYAVQFPAEVRRLAVLELLLPGFGLEERFDNSTPGRGSFHFAFHAAEGFPELLVSGREREYFAAFVAASEARDGAVTHADLDEYVRTYAQPDKLRAGFGLYRTLYQDAADNRAAARRPLAMPVLAMGGELGSADTVAGTVRPVARDVRAVALPGAGHWLAQENPAGLADELLRFLA